MLRALPLSSEHDAQRGDSLTCNWQKVKAEYSLGFLWTAVSGKTYICIILNSLVIFQRDNIPRKEKDFSRLEVIASSSTIYFPPTHSLLFHRCWVLLRSIELSLNKNF